PEESARACAVPVAVSAPHIEFRSVRMEPVFMILAESAACAAAIAIQQGCALQSVPCHRLRKLLLRRGQIVDW
ncbi:MAG: FAD-dependent oxidoreductase, partial [Spirochaetota bacterium]